MTTDKDEPRKNGQRQGFERSQFMADNRFIRSVYEEGVSRGESQIYPFLGNEDSAVSDMAFSFALCAELGDSVEPCVDLLIDAGFFSYEVDFWVAKERQVEFDCLFDTHDDVDPNQLFLREWVSEKQAAMDAFLDIKAPKTAKENTHEIFRAIEQNLCDNGVLFQPSWYAARILREFTKPAGRSDDFLIGVLWEQLRQKTTHSVELVKRQEQVKLLRNQSAMATDALVKRSNSWKLHCGVAARTILNGDARKHGLWSAIAGKILSDVEQLPNHSETKQAYMGKRSKNKPDGSNLVGLATVARFLSSRFKT